MSAHELVNWIAVSRGVAVFTVRVRIWSGIIVMAEWFLRRLCTCDHAIALEAWGSLSDLWMVV